MKNIQYSFSLVYLVGGGGERKIIYLSGTYINGGCVLFRSRFLIVKFN